MLTDKVLGSHTDEFKCLIPSVYAQLGNNVLLKAHVQVSRGEGLVELAMACYTYAHITQVCHVHRQPDDT